MRKVFVIVNPVVGNSQPEILREALQRRLADVGQTYAVYETTGQERLADVVRKALDRGFDVVVAAGGDGTVSGVAVVLVLRPRAVFDCFGVAWNLLLGRQQSDASVRCLRAKQTIVIRVNQPLAVQGDGEVIGQTPVEVRVMPSAVQVVTPRTGETR
jgi:diacylglycerol kinase family enzyme